MFPGGITTNNKQLGDRGEQRAVNYLQDIGWEILATNLEVPPGECDIVARNDDRLVFVEVKSADQNSPVPPEEEITSHKKDNLRRIARYVISRFSEPPHCRFDVITLRFFAGEEPELRHIESAFGGRQ